MTTFDAAFDELLAAYNQRMTLRDADADLAARAAAAGRHFRAQMAMLHTNAHIGR